MNQGKFVIVAMVVVGLAMAFFAWWTRYSASQRVLDRFGPDVATAVRKGDRVELLSLSVTPPPKGQNSSVEPEVLEVPISLGNTKLYITEIRDITKASGLIHARHHLIHDKGFDWEAPQPSTTGAVSYNWSVGLRFSDERRRATWILDFDRKSAYIVERKTEIGMAPIAPALRQFIDEL